MDGGGVAAYFNVTDTSRNTQASFLKVRVQCSAVQCQDCSLQLFINKNKI